MNIVKTFFLSILLCSFSGSVLAYTSLGEPKGFVNDFAGVLSENAKLSLESQLMEFEKQTSHEISVVTIKTLNGDSIEDYANTLFREWEIGKKDTNNGVLFLVALEDRKMRIEVGYGLEGALTDLESKHIQEDFVKPFFKENNYEQGIVLGANKIKEAIAGEIVSVPPKKSKKGINGSLVEMILFFGIFLLQWIVVILGRSKSWWLGGIIGGVFGLLVALVFGWWLMIGILTILGLLLDYVVSKNYQNHPDHPSWWAGGGGFGGGSGGGGFGGFGGGSSGGGGSSSSW